MDIKSEMVKLVEIDDHAILPIRDVKDDKEGYKLLKSAIELDGQRHPIVIRLLTEDEKNKVVSGAKYGIIDGHHRFAIAKENNQESILAEIDDEKASPIRDAQLALQLNGTAIRMSPIEKGEVIDRLIKLYGKQNETKNAGEIGKIVFGLQTAMAYRCYQEYRKSKGEVSTGTEKAPKKRFTIQDLHEAIGKLPKTQEELNIDEMTTDESVEQLKAISIIESQLRFYKAMLSSKEGVKEAYKDQKRVQKETK